MKIERLGDALALPIPADVAATLHLREGGEVRFEAAPGNDAIVVRRAMTREEALRTPREPPRPFPPGFRFPGDEANERG